jgi:hypothetical protein
MSVPTQPRRRPFGESEVVVRVSNRGRCMAAARETLRSIVVRKEGRRGAVLVVRGCLGSQAQVRLSPAELDKLRLQLQKTCTR